MFNSAYCTRCLKHLPEDLFDKKPDGSRKRICRADLTKASKRNAEGDVTIPYSDLIEDLVSNELSKSVTINLIDPDIDETLRISGPIMICNRQGADRGN